MSQTVELVIGKYSKTFERLACNICDNCTAQTDDCSALEPSCLHWSEMEELFKLCLKVDEAADGLLASSGRHERECATYHSYAGYMRDMVY